MEQSKGTILFMDDEPNTEPVRIAIESLQQEGFEVDLVNSMSEAIEAYYQKFYHIFILDIDMSHVRDKREGDGVQVLKQFVSLNNKTKVILFSGAGTVEHWFEAANAHCFAYIAKDESDSIKKLSAWSNKAVGDRSDEKPRVFSKQDCPRRIVCYCEKQEWLTQIQNSTHTELGKDWKIDLQEAPAAVAEDLSSYSNETGMVLLFKDVFELWPDEKKVISDICSHAPAPQIIIGCRGGRENQLRSSILFLANQHPFRLINLDTPGWTDELQKALSLGQIWYGRREIFQADQEALSRLQVSLPNDAFAHWHDYDPELDDEELEGGKA